MAKVFRLHTGANSSTDWFRSNAYGSNVIDQIKDPDGGKASKEITSIPSPFARIDLAKTAFKQIVDSVDHDGNSIYHKMVSDILDVAQIFFNYNNLQDKVQIIEWRVDTDLAALAGNTSHIGDTLNTFLQSDARTYNFANMQSIYLLRYIGPDQKTAMDIIGATSPATLFFSSANDLSYMSKQIHFGQDMPFDDKYNPLYNRDFAFVKYLFALRQSYPNFAVEFNEFNAYLVQTYSKLAFDKQRELQQEIMGDPNFSINNVYSRLQFNNAIGVSIVNGLNFHVKPKQKPNSDFEIASPKCTGDKPLVLPVDGGNLYSEYTYVTDKWNRDYKAPYVDSAQLDKRRLPYNGMEYPYLTIGDFLEEYLVKLPSDINSKAFFDGNKVNKGSEETYLIPVKPLYFQYFTTDNLTGEVSRGVKAIEMKEMAGNAVKVTLRIPVKNGKYVEYNRLYSIGTIYEPDKNDGGIKDFEFALGMLPNVKFKNDSDAFYRVGLVSDFGSIDKYELKCYCGSDEVATTQTIRNDNDKATPICQLYSVNGHCVEYMQIDCINANAKGLVIPLWQDLSGTDVFTFAIDLGTSNTHIEYSINGNKKAKAFDIAAEDMQMVMLTEQPDPLHKYILDADMIPPCIGGSEEFKFPMRTVMSAAKNTNWDQEVLPMGHANVSFTYGKRQTYKYNNLYTDLKWSNDKNSGKQIKAYIESLILLLRNKVVMNNGDLASTKIVWFYPISMTRARVSKLSNDWKDAYKKFFGSNEDNVMQMTESIAPYEFYKGQYGSANIVTVDIGGGTSDVVISSNNNVEFITSFRFAANSIFGNAYLANTGNLNGIVRFFKDNIKNTLANNDLNELIRVFDDLLDANNSADFASFFFSLADNKKVIEKGIKNDLDFNRMLSLDDKQKIVFVLFYAAMMYHIASIMKNKGHKMPRYIAFSGNGSKVVSILTGDKNILVDFTMKIFEIVYGEPYAEDGLDVIYKSEQPKEATCKGGISCDESSFRTYARTVDEKKVILKSIDNVSFATEEDTYEKIDDAYIQKVVSQVKTFVDFFFELNKKFKFNDNFEVDRNSIEIAKEVCYRDLDRFIRDGLTNRKKEVGEDQPVEETLFFYPLNGVLNALADKICEQRHD